MSTTDWRLAKSLEVLRREVNQRWPQRSKTSDGTKGDAAHASRPSDHNPNTAGVVRALDITASGIDANWYAEHIRHLGVTGFKPLMGGGYVIWNRRSASEKTEWQWKPYTGLNPHDKHIHVSVSRSAAGYDATTPWGVNTPGTHDNEQDDFLMALTHSQQIELLTRVRNAEEKATNASVLAASCDQRCERLERSVHGIDNDSKGKSLFIKMTYLAAETIDSPKGAMLDRALRKFGAE